MSLVEWPESRRIQILATWILACARMTAQNPVMLVKTSIQGVRDPCHLGPGSWLIPLLKRDQGRLRQDAQNTLL
jgi:hypothetical protein